MKYTSTSNIANRLRGRASLGQSTPFGASQVDPDFIAQIGAQVEARVDAQLGQVYKLPLSGVHLPLASVVEKLVICEIMGTHYVGQEANPSDGFGRMMCKMGADELAAIVNRDPPLPGEVQLGGGTETPGVSNVSIAAQRIPGAAEAIAW